MENKTKNSFNKIYHIKGKTLLYVCKTVLFPHWQPAPPSARGHYRVLFFVDHPRGACQQRQGEGGTGVDTIWRNKVAFGKWYLSFDCTLLLLLHFLPGPGTDPVPGSWRTIWLVLIVGKLNLRPRDGLVGFRIVFCCWSSDQGAQSIELCMFWWPAQYEIVCVSKCCLVAHWWVRYLVSVFSLLIFRRMNNFRRTKLFKLFDWMEEKTMLL